ncbi:MAG: ribonuclease H-like YkuK family protein [Candidatus Doudnabacteria bacterium]|nr:ribonuclease H-like YkuK family protein [Candidatus Doudnabacteria bacterium]
MDAQMLKTKTKQETGLFFSDFKSQTYGSLNWDDMLSKLLAYIGAEPGLDYELIIGSDSMSGHSGIAEFVSAIVVHRKNKGGIYFWSKRSETQIHTLRQRIFEEALLSLRLAEQLIEALKSRDISDFGLTIHVDIGPNGETKQMMHEIVGMIRGNGFEVKTKPDSYGASSVADRHT